MQNTQLINLKRVNKQFQTEAGPFLALKDINLEIGTGEFVGVIGKSGSGKSTLINMITGIDRPTNGEVIVAETPIHTLSEGEVAKWRGTNLGIVFQFFQLLPTLTVLENIILPMDFTGMYGSGERKKRAMELLEMVDLIGQENKLPSQLSGGQQQRVAIARSIANNPKLIVADEPTGNLDSQTSERVFTLFEHLVNDGKTVLMVTHDDDQAKRVGRTIIISDGELIEEYIVKSFPALNSSQLKWVTSKLQKETFRPGQQLIKQGAKLSNLYFVTSGAADIVIEFPGGSEVIVATYERGQYFGEIELVEGKSSQASVRVHGKENLEVAKLSKKDFDQLMKQSSATRDQIGKVAMQRLTENLQTRKRKGK